MSPVSKKLSKNVFYYPDTTQTFVGTNFVISGWGTTSSGGSQSGPLKAAFVSGMSNQVKKIILYFKEILCLNTQTII